jgi:hypothetical protein
MTDADTKDMRSWLITTQTSSRREGGGYIICRGYFPHYGFIRKSVYQIELDRVPTTEVPEVKKEENTDVVMVWSNDIEHDLMQARLFDQRELDRIGAIA